MEVSRTLVKSPPELWEELQGECLSELVGPVTVSPTEPERVLSWSGAGVTGTARLEPSSWGTKVTLTAEVEDRVAEFGLWGRLRGRRPPPGPHDGLEERLHELLDSLGSAHRQPFARG